MKRALAIAGAALLQTTRSRAAWFAALCLLMTVPALAWVSGDDASTRAWITRLLPVEALRLLMPLAAIVGAAFLVRPAVKAGWAVLPAHRAEWFGGMALTGTAVLVISTALFGAGAMLAGAAYGEPLSRTVHPQTLTGERTRDGNVETRQFQSGMALAMPGNGEAILVAIPEGVGEQVAGMVEFESVLTGDAAPSRGSPLEVWVDGEGTKRRLEVAVEGRKRIRFSGERAGAARVVLRPTDPAVGIGTSLSRIRFELGQSPPLGSLLSLMLLSLGGALLCLFVVLAIRALSTAATAALAGMLLMATLTLMPSLAPAERMARDLRRDLGGERQEPGLIDKLQAELTALPQLFPDRYYDEFLSGRVVPPGTGLDAVARFGIGLLLLAPGAWLFSRRQIR